MALRKPGPRSVKNDTVNTGETYQQKPCFLNTVSNQSTFKMFYSKNIHKMISHCDIVCCKDTKLIYKNITDL